MDTMKLLKRLKNDKKITVQQFRTYKGQVIHGDEIGCIKGLMRKHLITDAEADALILSYKLAYTEQAGDNMAREDLVSLADRTTEEQQTIARAGGIASGKARRAKKMFRETLESILAMPMKTGESMDVEEIQNFAAIKGQNISVQEAILIAQVQKAMKGDTRAAEYVRDSIGQKPTDNMNMAVNLPVFFEGEDELEE